MKEYLVIKDILNVRSKPIISDETFVGQLLRGDTVWLEDDEIPGEIPLGGTSNVWKLAHQLGVVAKDGVEELSWEAKKKLLIQDIKVFWRKSKGKSIAVALLDTGIKPFHKFLNKNIIPIQVQDVNKKLESHGTAMASLMIGFHDEEEIVGISPEIKLYDYKIVSNPDDFRIPDHMINALENICGTVNDISVINISMEMSNKSTRTVKIESLITECVKQKKIVVAATGNDRDIIKYPGNSNEVITVGVIKQGVAENFTKSIDLSQYKVPDCFIEIEDWPICSIDINNNDDDVFDPKNRNINSSEVTVVMSALISLKLSLNNNLTQNDIKNCIQQCSTPFYSSGNRFFKLNIDNFLNSQL